VQLISAVISAPVLLEHLGALLGEIICEVGELFVSIPWRCLVMNIHNLVFSHY
jgi:hypothetical protein